MKKIWEPNSNSTRVLMVFRWLYCWGVALNLYLDRNHLLGIIEAKKCFVLPLFADFGLPIVSSVHADLVFWALIGCLLFLGVGFLSWLWGGLSTLLFLWLVGTAIGCAAGRSDPAYMNWQHCIVVFNLLAISFSPGSERIFDFRKMKVPGERLQPFDGRSALCNFVLFFNLIFAYFAGGIAKLQYGWDWANGYTLQGHLIYTHLHSDIPKAVFLIPQIHLLQGVSWVVLIAELLAPLTLFFFRASVVFVLGSLFFQILFYYLIDLRWMSYFGWAYLIYFVDWYFILREKQLHKKQKPMNQF